MDNMGKPQTTLDLSQYPDGTDRILAAMSKHAGIAGKGVTRSDLAGYTGLSKTKVRYRVDRLIDDGIVEERTVEEAGNRVCRYTLVANWSSAAENAEVCMDILDEIPEQMDSEQLLELIDEIKYLRSEVRNIKHHVFDSYENPQHYEP